MTARLQICRDDGTLLIETMLARVEQGGGYAWQAHPAEGPIIENGMYVYGIRIVTDCKASGDGNNLG